MFLDCPFFIAPLVFIRMKKIWRWQNWKEETRLLIVNVG
jgi:hypothetical protein